MHISNPQRAAELALKWKRAIDSGEKSEADLVDWLEKNEDRMTPNDLGIFRMVYEDGRIPQWHGWHGRAKVS